MLWVVRWIGSGQELWRVRVDLLIDDARADSACVIAERLGLMLIADSEPAAPSELGVDRGLGVTARPVLGLLFWVRANDVGDAATSAVGEARSAAAECRMAFELYDVTLIPEQAVVLPDVPLFPPLPD
jgi:hypothetical protein